MAFLNDYYKRHIWKTDKLQGDFLEFLAKVQLQKEILHIARSQQNLKEVQLATYSFAQKSNHPVGTR